MKLGEFLNKLFTDVGIAYDDPSVKAVLSSPSIIELDVPDDLTGRVLSNLLTQEAAEANPKIKSLITAKALNPIDSKIEALAEKHGINDKWLVFKDANVKRNADGRFNTYDAIEKFNDFIAEELKGKFAGASQGDKSKMIKDIEDLNAKILTTQQSYEQKIQQLQSERQSDRINWTLDNLYSSYKYAMEDTLKMPKEVCIETAKNIASKKLKENGLKVVADDLGNIVLRTSEDTPYFEQNKQVSVSDYFSKVFADNNLLQASAPSTAPVQQMTAPQVNANVSRSQNAAISKLAAQIAEANQI
jgi:hypothetical protein